MKYLFVLFVLLSAGSASFAQESTDQQLANLYYNNGEYAKALEYF